MNRKSFLSTRPLPPAPEPPMPDITPPLVSDLDFYKKKIAEIELQKAAYDTKQKQENIKPANQSDVKMPKQIWHKFMLNRKRSKAILVNMELKTGDHRHFVAYYDDMSFLWQHKTFVVDDSLKYYDIDSQIYCLDYHEDFSLPVKRIINVKELRKAVALPGVTDVDHAINPTTLKYFIESQVLEKMMRGADMDKVFDFMKRLLIMILIVAAITLILIVNASGILKNVKIPGLG